MKALVRRYPFNAKKEELSEVYVEPQWHDWIGSDGFPLTDENYGYALCEGIPDDATDLIPEDFTIEEHVKGIEEEDGRMTVFRYWTASYVPQPRPPIDMDE
jgi:hypothetical protein